MSRDILGLRIDCECGFADSKSAILIIVRRSIGRTPIDSTDHVSIMRHSESQGVTIDCAALSRAPLTCTKH